MPVASLLFDTELQTAQSALVAGTYPLAESILRRRLRKDPSDISAMSLLAEALARLGQEEESAALLRTCLNHAPGFSSARYRYAALLSALNRPQEALVQIETLLKENPHDIPFRKLKAASLFRLGKVHDAARLYSDIVATAPNEPRTWLSYGHVLKAAGKTPESVAAYHNAIAAKPGYGEAYWALANLKSYRFAPAEIAAMERQLDARTLPSEELCCVHFALGHALEANLEYEAAFAHFAEANALHRQKAPYDPEVMHERTRRSKKLFSASFFGERAGFGDKTFAPIFVVGLPRSGSTLVEQILASHPEIEGTAELPEIPALARRLSARRRATDPSPYPENIKRFDAEHCARMGALYIESARTRRQLGRSRFVDKMPNNFAHIGLIHLILPNARIIDVRRHPMACGFSCFKQHFGRGQAFAYDLTDIGRYYRNYMETMAHFTFALPGRIHTVIYEDLVANPECEVRRLLAYCGVAFDERCLRFHETNRPVQTPSAQQVRRPIYRDATDQWRHFDPWLAPLKRALGGINESYSVGPQPETIPDFGDVV